MRARCMGCRDEGAKRPAVLQRAPSTVNAGSRHTSVDIEGSSGASLSGRYGAAPRRDPRPRSR